MMTRNERFFYRAMNLVTWNTAGSALAIGGSGFSICGALVNNLLLQHTLAMNLWMISNPFFVAYFSGVDTKLWNGHHLSTRLIIATYVIFTITNFYGLSIS